MATYKTLMNIKQREIIAEMYKDLLDNWVNCYTIGKSAVKELSEIDDKLKEMIQEVENYFEN